MEQDKKFYSIFPVDKQSFCVWDPDVKALNLEFINRLDHKFFEYLAHTNAAEIDGEDKHLSATALRFGYYHGLETLFALICSTLQAPDCVVGWMHKYSTGQLRGMISAISQGTVEFPFKLKLHTVTWDTIAGEILKYSHPDETRRSSTITLFAKFWKRLGHVFLNEYSIGEYNSIKHGLRTGAGGFALAIGKESKPGIAASESEMHTLGASSFGHSFFVVETVSTASNDPNLQIARSSIAWDPTAVSYALLLISFSIQNVTSYLKIQNGVPPSQVVFTRPQEDDAFEKPFDNPPTVPTITIRLGFQKEAIPVFTKDELDKMIREQLTQTNPGAAR